VAEGASAAEGVSTPAAAGSGNEPDESVTAVGKGAAEDGEEANTTAAVVAASESGSTVFAAEQPAKVIQPDVKFVREVMAAGGGDLKKCYQCATCSVVCNITPDDMPFPRKEMQWAQWGLKDKLIGDPDVWLCHQCSDCVAQCPRGAKPGRVMQAIAKMTIPSLSWPSFLGKAVGNPAALLVMAAIPILIIALLVGTVGDFTPIRGEDLNHDGIIKGAAEHEGEIVFSQFMPILAIDITYSLFFFFAIVVFALGVKKYWSMMVANARSEGIQLKGSGFSQLGPAITEILAHRRFGKCDETKDRKISHLFIFYAFVLLFLTTALSVFFHYILKKYSPYPQIGPVKFLGNAGAIAGIVGISLIVINRFKHQEKVGLGSYFDWLLIFVILLIMITGILSEIFRLANIGAIAFPAYFIHLSVVLFLFVYAPFSKMAHMVYRTVAMVFARTTGRDTPI
jgi:quinone-modifying oxidoreductase subunit QmoC